MSARRPWLAGLAVALLFAAALIPLPGVLQGAALAQLGRTGALWATHVGPFPPAFSILSTGLLGLVLARFALGVAVDRARPAPSDAAWTWTLAAMFVAASWLGGVAMSLALHERFRDLYAVEPVLGALVDGVVVAVAGALLWSLADLVRASGVASGALLLFAAWESVRILRFLAELVAAAAAGEPELAWLALHSGLVPVALMMLSLWRFRPAAGERPVWRGLTVRGPLDLLALPLVAGALASVVADDLMGYPSWTPQPPLYDPGLLPRTLAALLAVPAIGAWVRRGPGAPGSIGWFLGALALLGLTVGLFVALWFG